MPGGRPRTRPETEKKTRGDFIIMVEGPLLETQEKVDAACRLIRQRCRAWEGAGRPKNLQRIAELVTFNLELIVEGREPPKAWITFDICEAGDAERLLTILMRKPPTQAQMLTLLTGRSSWEGDKETGLDRINAEDARRELNAKDKYRRDLRLAWEIADEIRQWK